MVARANQGSLYLLTWPGKELMSWVLVRNQVYTLDLLMIPRAQQAISSKSKTIPNKEWKSVCSSGLRDKFSDFFPYPNEHSL